MTYEKLQYDLKNKDVVQFEYKWTEDDDAETFGPFSAEQMIEWQKQGFFNSGVFVRNLSKVTQDVDEMIVDSVL